MENTKEWKERFFALYWGQDVLCSDMYGDGGTIYSPTMRTDSSEDRWLELKPLQSISNEDAIEVAKLVHQIDTGWGIKRRDEDKWGSIHIERVGNINDVYHVGINYKRGEIYANHHFLKTEQDPHESFKVNIGKINLTDRKPVPYIAITDYLRSKGYALPFMGVDVETLEKWGWIKIKTD